MLTKGCGVNADLATAIGEDVLMRARSFAALGEPVREVLMTPFLEEVFDHEPADATLELKAAVTVVVRNSLLEEAHTDGPLESGGIQAITSTHPQRPAMIGSRCSTRSISGSTAV